MNDKEFMEYVIEHKRIGLDNSQIARKLGMDPYIFEDICKNAFSATEKYNIPESKIEPLPPIKPRKEKVEGIFYVPQGDDVINAEEAEAAKIEENNS